MKTKQCLEYVKSILQENSHFLVESMDCIDNLRPADQLKFILQSQNDLNRALVKILQNAVDVYTLEEVKKEEKSTRKTALTVGALDDQGFSLGKGEKDVLTNEWGLKI